MFGARVHQVCLLSKPQVCVRVAAVQVRYLKIIEKSGYQALPWVRYITQNGDYQLRTQ